MSVAYDPFSAEWQRDPYPVFRQLFARRNQEARLR